MRQFLSWRWLRIGLRRRGWRRVSLQRSAPRNMARWVSSSLVRVKATKQAAVFALDVQSYTGAPGGRDFRLGAQALQCGHALVGHSVFRLTSTSFDRISA